MKATMTSTDRVLDIKDPQGRPAQARVWEGVSEAGIPFTAYVTLVQVATGADQAEFARELQEHKQPSPGTIRAIDARFIL